MQSNQQKLKHNIIRILWVIFIISSTIIIPQNLYAQNNQTQQKVKYGANPKGRFAEVNNIKLYYETYGNGQPILMIHGNGGNITAMSDQIKFFSPKHKVIVADSRGHGKSEIGAGRLTYEQMSEDLNLLLEQLKLKSVYILGWSDGGIIGLLLAINHPDKVAKLAIMGANLNPSAAYDWALQWGEKEYKRVNEMIDKGDKSQPWAILKQQLDLLSNQPNIPVSDLKKISAPTLVMAGDKDVIRTEHTVQIFENLPNAHLCIFPGSTHIIPQQNASLFNRTVATFFKNSYSRPDTKDLFQ
jgi:pimeloyl-ACP methyl ester carboxylesterase